jgi:hypothetical protein
MLKRLSIKWTSIAIAVAMLVSLFPPVTAFAAASLMITNLTYINAAEPAANDTVDRLTTNPITLSVIINGFAEDQISNIYYEITNVNNGKTITEKTNKPIKSPSNNNEITFINVYLTEGLNKITVKYGDTSVISSLPGWVYFTPVTNITDLKLNGGPFLDDQMYPSGPPYTSLNITGTANNATQIQATVNGAVYDPAVFTRGTFTYIANTGRINDLNFSPGDNEIQFIARNGTNFYTLTKPFVYDNGKAFAYKAFIKQSGAPAGSEKKLIQTPTVTNAADPSNTNVEITANLKNSITGGVKDYVYADIFTLGTAGNYSVRVDLTNTSSLTITPSGALAGTLTAPTIAYDSAASKPEYDVFNFTATLPTNSGSKYQEVIFRFTTSAGTFVDSKYSFYFQDTTLPYIDYAAKSVNSGPEVRLSEIGTSPINEFPATLNIYTNDQATHVKVKIRGVDYDDGTTGGTGLYPVTVSGSVGKASVTLQGIRDGQTDIQIIPYKSGAPNFAGQKTYSVAISSAPYIIINNLYNGMVVNKPEQLVCGATSGPCIQGRVVNLPASEYANIELSINNTLIKLSGKNPFDGTGYIDPATGVFTLANPGQAFYDANNSSTPFYGDGKKSIKFSIYLQGQLVTETNYDVFVLSDDVPLINKFIPYEAPNTPTKFKPGSKPDTYVTNETEVSLIGEVANSNIVSGQWKIHYRKTGDTTYTDLTYPGDYNSVAPTGSLTAPFLQQFTTKPIPLNQYGDYTFEIIAQNQSGLTVSKAITITREPQSYVILSPALIKNADGKDQANINKNFQKIQIQADQADSVLIGKDQAVKDTSILNKDVFTYEVTGLKPGKNEIKFTINRGNDKQTGSFILYYVNTPIEGAQEKQKLKNKLTLFNGDLEISFPKDTKLMKNDRTLADHYLTVDRDILFGIANNDDGIVDKTIEGNNSPTARNFLNEPTGRFTAASKRYWIDAGTIPAPTDPSFSLSDALQGSGRLPLEGTQFYTRNIKDLVVPTKPGTITLKYDPAIRDDAWKYVTVYQYGIFEDENGSGTQYSGWKNLGGVVDPKKNTITVPFESFGFFQVMYMNNSFDDVTGHPWARDDLDTLYSKGIMSNPDYSPGRFLPEDPITRGEFVTMLVKIFNIPLKNEDTAYGVNDPNDPKYQGTFSDVRRGFTLPNSGGLYDFLHIEAAARAGIVRGTSQGLFLPASSITRQDAAVMIARAADLKMQTDPAKSLASLSKSFTDASSIDAYARGAVEAVAKAGLIEGKPNLLLQGQKKETYRFDPVENMTRAEAAAIAMRVLRQQKKIPK